MKLFSQQFSECRANDYCLERTFVPFKGNPKILPAFPNKKMMEDVFSGRLMGLHLIKCGKFGGVCSGANKKCKELRGVDSHEKDEEK